MSSSDAPPTNKTLIKQGAEAHLYHTTFLTPTHPSLLKHRPSKAYRHPIVDVRLTKHRCLSEARLLVRGVTVPAIYFVDEARGEIYMEWITGRTLREVLDNALTSTSTSTPPTPPTPAPDLQILMPRIGSAIAAMHALDVIHGDLTTSNIMIRRPRPDEDGDAEEMEDMAVDLYVLERAFISTHPRAGELLKEVLMGYERGLGKIKGAQVLMRLEEVRLRRRKRSMLG
ncbi:hypothetical protein EV426DRAFT_634617 [Tirmania nivea]|nr:hypothetical protein EV426DRAFT_634617 [Tirmania nivea]